MKTMPLNKRDVEFVVDLISNLAAYGKIHTVEGISYSSGTHKEYIEKADRYVSNLRGILKGMK